MLDSVSVLLWMRMGFLRVATFFALTALLAAACGSSGDDESSGPGQSGGTVEIGGECGVTSQCKQGPAEVACVCDGVGPTRCVALVDFDQPCEFGGTDCRSGSSCVNDVCTRYGKLGDSCSPGLCAPGSTCQEHVCVAAGGVDAPCSAIDPGPCLAGAYCPFSGVCTAQLAPGGECTNSKMCADGGKCVSTGGSATCHAVRKAGETCEGTFECEEDFDCRFGEASTERTCQLDTTPTTCL